MPCVLAVDYGEKRIGLAVSNEGGITASPLSVIVRSSDADAVRKIAQIAETLKIEAIVVGLPVRTDEKAGEMERRVKAFAEKLRQRTKLTVLLFDERFTSSIAERVLLEADVSRRKRKVVRDKLAAAVLLQSYLEWQQKNTFTKGLRR